MKLDGMLFNKYEDKEVSVYANTETIDEFVEEFDIELEHINQEEYYDMLDEEEYLILSRCFNVLGDDYWIVEPLIEDNGRQAYNECEIALMEKGISDVIDFDKIDCDRFDMFDGVVTYAGEEEVDSGVNFEFNEDDLNRRTFQEIANIILDDLENLKDGECPCCILRDYVKRIYTIGVNDANEKFSMMLDTLNGNMSDYVNKAFALAKEEVD